MKYKEIVKIIKNISLALPDVQSFYTGDVYEVNADQSVKYSSVVLTNQEHQFDNVNDRFQYNFILFYIDRLTDDENNRTDVHTAAVSALKTIVQHLEDYDVIINDFKFNLFRERFNDQCAGAYATLSVKVEDNDCTDGFSFDFGQISPDKLKEISITTNGVYTPDDGYYYTKVSVNVPIPEFTTEELSVTANGTYIPNTDGYSKVEVNVEPNLQAKTIEITENGTQTIVADSNYDGLESVNIEVNVSATSSKFIVPNGMKFAYSNGFDPNYFDFSNVTDMSHMFNYCSNLETLDIGGWDTSMVTDMSYMFDNTSLTSLDINNWDVSTVTNMSHMFNFNTSLASLGLSNWNPSACTDMSYMFNYCYQLPSLNIKNLRVSSVTSMSSMFSNCRKLSSLDLSGWDTSNVIRLDYMFAGCSGLTSLGIGNWNMSKATQLNSMFRDCSKLRDLDMNGATLPAISLEMGLETCTKLTSESLVSVLNALPNVDEDVPYTCVLGSTNLAKLTSEQIAIATDKGWVLS